MGIAVLNLGQLQMRMSDTLDSAQIWSKLDALWPIVMALSVHVGYAFSMLFMSIILIERFKKNPLPIKQKQNEQK